MLQVRPSGGDALAASPLNNHWHSALLLAAAGLCLAVLGVAQATDSWMSGVAMHRGHIHTVVVGLETAELTPPGGRAEVLGLDELCRMHGSAVAPRGQAPAPWCPLAAAGADVSSLLHSAWLPAMLVVGVSAFAIVGQRAIPLAQLADRFALLGLSTTVYDGAVLFLWFLFSSLLAVAVCIYAFRVPTSLGLGAAVAGRSYGLARGCLLISSICAIGLFARVLKLWDTRTMQNILADMAESRTLKLALYLMLGLQMVCYLVVSLVSVDWAAVIVFLGLNYLGTRSPQLLWTYALLTLISLPQDAVELSSIRPMDAYHRLDYIALAANGAFVLLLALKALILAGMVVLHTHVNISVGFRSDPPPREGYA